MAFFLTFKRPCTLTLMVWGGLAALIYSPIISFLTVKIVQITTKSRWFSLIGFYLFPLFELISIIIFIIGLSGFITKKMAAKRNENREKVN